MDDCIDHGRRHGYDTYAYKWRDGKQYPLHRLVYADKKGIPVKDLPFEIVVRHTCDNRRCINPEHLIEGSRKENTQDMVLRGSFNSVLTKEEVIEIKASPLPVLKLAEIYKVDRHTIQKIKNKKAWSHIASEEVKSLKDSAHGEKNGNSSLTEDEVSEILSSALTQRKLASLYGVSQTAIWAIKSGKTWKHKTTPQGV